MSNFEDFMIGETVQANSKIRTLLAERDTLRAENTRLRSVLERLFQWDHFDAAGDGSFWRKEITTALAEGESR